MLAKGAILLDFITLFISWLLGQELLHMALGLLFGTLFQLLLFTLLGLNVQRSLQTGKPPAARRRMVMGSLGRYLLCAVAIWVGIRSPWLNVFGVVFPLFYPKILYFSRAVYQQIRSGKEEK
jgi:multisubunit Na+/H+ antiporter MnhE subunit